MSIPGSAAPFLLARQPEQYRIQRSLRFNSSDSAYLSRTPASAGNRRTYTYSAWVKRAAIGSGTYYLFTAVDGSNVDIIGFEADRFYWYNSFSGSVNSQALYRDPSAWYHVLASVDSTQAVATDRVKLYVNGVEVAYNAVLYPSLNRDFAVNNTVVHKVGQYFTTNSSDFYLADIHFIDGQALDPTSFGEFDTNGVWQPKAYNGTYPGNSFHLPFSNNSTAAALGTDTSGNSNNWTVNNISVAAGANNDSLVDTPTSYGTDTGAGGEVRGNYATLNPLDITSGMTLSNGNLEVAQLTGADKGAYGTIGVSSGKWYWEVQCTANIYSMVGIADLGKALALREYPDTTGGGLYYHQVNGALYGYLGGSFVGTSYGAAFTSASDIVGVALDMDNGNVSFYKNGVNQGVANTSSLLGKTIVAAIGNGGATASNVINFGQRPFAYPAPSGFKALCTTNLPAPLVAKPSEVMDVKLYTGNGGTQPISGLGFSPDLVWLKSRSQNSSHCLLDTVRGRAGTLNSNDTTAEYTASPADKDLVSFDSTGFTLGQNYNNVTNTSSETYVAWTWDAGSSTVTNNAGSIASQVRANPGAGFSIVTYTGTGANATVGHGLNDSPGLIIVKCRNVARNWNIYSAALGADKYLQFTTAAAATDNTVWNNTPPASTVFSVGTSIGVNGSTETHVAYCFAPVAGYSAFGSYTGNGSADGPAVFTSMRLRFLLIKRTDSAANWLMYDSERDSFNSVKAQLYPNSSSAENPGNDLDFLSNGFKLRTTNTALNASAGTYIYCAFAEHPFQYARAR